MQFIGKQLFSIFAVGSNCGPHLLLSGHLKLMVSVYWALLYSGAVPDFTSADLSCNLYLSPNYTSRSITIAIGDSYFRVGSLVKVSRTFDYKAAKLEFFVFKNSPFDISIGLCKPTAMLTNMYFGVPESLVKQLLPKKLVFHSSLTISLPKIKCS